MPRPPRNTRRSAFLCVLSQLVGCGLLVAGLLALPSVALAARGPASLDPSSGLERAWFTQIQVDSARNKVVSVVLDGDAVAAMTSAGTLQVFDSETGALRWTKRIGVPIYPNLGPAIGGGVLAAVNGSTLHVLDLADGREKMTQRLGGAVAEAPCIGKGMVFVPLFSGRIEGYPLDDAKGVPWYYQSAGRIFQPPTAGGERIFWATDRGNFYGAGAQGSGTDYRFETSSDLITPPGAGAGLAFAGTASGYVYALEELTGVERWRYSAGAPVVQAPQVLGDRVYFTTDSPALHAVNLQGRLLWETSGVSKFVAAGAKRVYGIDSIGRFLVIDGESGAIRSRTGPYDGLSVTLNDQTDRLYVYTAGGLLQCFRERGSKEPYRHAPPADAKTLSDEAAEAAAEAKDGANAADPAAADPDAGPPAEAVEDPFAGDLTDDPFAPEAGEGDAPEEPAPAEPGASEDPFGASEDGGAPGGEDSADPFGADPGADPFGGSEEN